MKIKCFACKSENIHKNVCTVSNIWSKGYGVATCKNCGLFFLENKPDNNELKKYYAEEYYNYSNFAIKTMKKIFRYFRCKSQYYYLSNNIGNISNKNILEIGAGDGMLLSLFKNNNLLGTEYNSSYKNNIKKKYGFKIINRDLLQVEGVYDLILMSHVIEHFTEIDQVVFHLKDILCSSGYLFIEVPNSPSLGKIDNRTLKDYLCTTHIYNFTVESWKYFAKNYGFKIVSLDRFCYRFPDNYSDKKKQLMSMNFLKGTSPKKRYIISALKFICKSIISPKRSYKRININDEYQGYGDNIRIILEVA